MSQNLYSQLKFIEEQCRIWNFSKRDTAELLKLCPYGFADKFPAREDAPRIRNGRVITAPPE